MCINIMAILPLDDKGAGSWYAWWPSLRNFASLFVRRFQKTGSMDTPILTSSAGARFHYAKKSTECSGFCFHDDFRKLTAATKFLQSHHLRPQHLTRRLNFCSSKDHSPSDLVSTSKPSCARELASTIPTKSRLQNPAVLGTAAHNISTRKPQHLVSSFQQATLVLDLCTLGNRRCSARFFSLNTSLHTSSRTVSLTAQLVSKSLSIT
jgi:hypothetical protein